MTQIRILSVSRHLFQLPFFSVPRELSAAIPVLYESNLNLVVSLHSLQLLETVPREN